MRTLRNSLEDLSSGAQTSLNIPIEVLRLCREPYTQTTILSLLLPSSAFFTTSRYIADHNSPLRFSFPLVKSISQSFHHSAHPRTGGKGTPRRKVVKKSVTSTQGDDRKLQAALKKLGVQPITGVEEVNMFKEDGNVLHFNQPRGERPPPPRMGKVYRGCRMQSFSQRCAVGTLFSYPASTPKMA